MKVHYSADKKRACWYDHHIRLWVMQERDVNGDQIGECDCTTNKKNAIKWVKTGTFNKDQ